VFAGASRPRRFWTFPKTIWAFSCLDKCAPERFGSPNNHSVDCPIGSRPCLLIWNSKIENGKSGLENRNSKIVNRQATIPSPQRHRGTISKSGIRKLKFENGNWKIENREFLIQNRKAKIQNRRSSIANHKSPIADGKSTIPLPLWAYSILSENCGKLPRKAGPGGRHGGTP